MEKTRTTVTNVIKSRRYDCIEVIIDGTQTQIVFEKTANVEQYMGKDVFISKNVGEDYLVEEATEEPGMEHELPAEEYQVEDICESTTTDEYAPEESPEIEVDLL